MIGIFDSGIGGLTVVKEIIKELPEYELTYFGDTARTPYGNKSNDTIIKYAIQDTEFLMERGAKIIVIACNTASAVASDTLRSRFPDVPIFEVITPAVNQAVKVSQNKRIGVIGTRATVDSHIYEEKIKTLHSDFKIISKACPLFVPLAEENWIDHPVTKVITKRYLNPLQRQQIDTLILGCTHYPLLKKIIQVKIGKKVRLVDPAEQTTIELKKFIHKNSGIEKNLLRGPDHQYFFSDVPPHLKEIAQRWLGQSVQPQERSIS